MAADPCRRCPYRADAAKPYASDLLGALLASGLKPACHAASKSGNAVVVASSPDLACRGFAAYIRGDDGFANPESPNLLFNHQAEQVNP